MKEIFTLWRELMDKHPEYRVGQALFNAISALDRDLAERLRQENHCNPYYVNARVGAAIKWLYEQELS